MSDPFGPYDNDYDDLESIVANLSSQLGNLQEEIDRRKSEAVRDDVTPRAPAPDLCPHGRAILPGFDLCPECAKEFKRKTKRKSPERDLHRDCWKWFARAYPLYTALFITNKTERKQSAIAVRMGKLVGVKAGVPDIFIAVMRGDYGGLWIELKAPKGTLDTAQSAMHDELRMAGYRVEVCRSLEAFRGVVDEYLEEAWK